MKAKQISIFIENKKGRLSEVTQVLKKSGINIRVLSLADTADFGILRLIVNDVDKTMQVLKENDFTVMVNEVLALEINDKAGALADLLENLSSAGINVEYMYAFAGKEPSKAVMILRIEELDKGIEIFQKTDWIRVMTSEELSQL